MNFIDLVILVIVLGTLGVIAYFNFIRKVASPYVQDASHPHNLRKLNLVDPEKSGDFSYAIKKDKDVCRSCPYKKDNCDCGRKK